MGTSPISSLTFPSRYTTISFLSSSNVTRTSSSASLSTLNPRICILDSSTTIIFVSCLILSKPTSLAVLNFIFNLCASCCVACKSALRYSDNSACGMSRTDKPFFKYSFRVSCFLVSNSYRSAHASRDSGCLMPRCMMYSIIIVSNTAPLYLKPDSHNHTRSWLMLWPISTVALSKASCTMLCPSLVGDTSL